MTLSRTSAIALCLLATTLALAAIPARAKSRPQPALPHLERVEATRPAFAGLCVAVAEGHDRAHTEQALDDALAGVARLGAALASADTASEISRLGRRALTARVTCSRGLWAALAAALDAARESEGAYDPTAAPLERVWRKAGAGQPDPAEFARAREATGWNLVVTEPGSRSVRLQHDGVELELDGTGAGTALDAAIDSLRARQVRRASLTLGGVAAVFADEGSGWGLPVADPTDGSRAALTLTARQGATATLGPAPHAVDPRSGMPLRSTASVTVVARSAARAQALSRALLVMGREAAQRFAAGHPDLGVLWLEPDGDTLDAWRWNLAPVTVQPGVTLRWME